MDSRTHTALLAMYDAPDPDHPGRVIPGYDRDHAERTTRIVLRAAQEVGLPERWLPGLEITCLLHDLGRAGMDPGLFGKIFGLAQERGLPLRPTDFRARYPGVPEERAVAFYCNLIGPVLREQGIALTKRVRDHIRMRLDFKGRLREHLARRARELKRLGIAVEPWMEAVMLYYYYPHLMEGQPADVRLMGELLVACENFEAYNNVRRGRDYYGRRRELLRDVFTTLAGFQQRGLISDRVMAALRRLAALGQLDAIIRESRGLMPDTPLPEEDVTFQRELAAAR